MNRDKSGPAFPGKYVKHYPGEVGNEVAIYERGSGMTIRDYAEIELLAAIINARPHWHPKIVASETVEYVEAWLSERDKRRDL